MMTLILTAVSDYLIGFMAMLMVFALLARFQAYRVSKRDRVYFYTLTREMVVLIEKEKEQKVRIENVDSYVSELIARVGRKIPDRSLRLGTREKPARDCKLLSLQDYVGGKYGFLANIQSEASVFHCQTPPNFTELTHRLLAQDDKWNKLIGPVPLDGISRLIDVLPGMFVVFGVFGTFVGISLALPEVARIDFSNIDGSAKTLAQFVLNTTFAMKTSVAGIFSSLVLTLLNALYPIKEVRGRIFKQIETTLQALWYHVQQSRSTDARIEMVLERLCVALERMTSAPTGAAAPGVQDSDKKEAA
jgi:hypothetical protein